MDGSAHKLPLRTIIFSAKEREDQLIVEVDEETLYYLAIVAG